jgi:hypothetical protein
VIGGCLQAEAGEEGKTQGGQGAVMDWGRREAGVELRVEEGTGEADEVEDCARPRRLVPPWDSRVGVAEDRI